MPRIVSKEELLAMAGAELGPSEWLVVDQERIDRFAEATGDRQFIHVDPERAAATPFGGTIAHGFLTLSLLPRLSREIAVVPAGVQMVVNYGLDRVRLLSPVRVDSAVRLLIRVRSVREKGPDRLLVASEATVEIRGEERPALIAQTLTLFQLAGDAG